MTNNYAMGIDAERRYEGVLSVLKPPGLTSSDVVTDLRRIFEIKRIGHAGTLDPGAAGVLLVCVGRATRLFDHLVDKKKEYIAEIEFGVSTDTQDSYGQVTGECDKRVSLLELIDILPKFTGRHPYRDRASLYMCPLNTGWILKICYTRFVLLHQANKS